MVILRLFKQSRSWFDNLEDFTQDGEPTLVIEKALLFANGAGIREIIAHHLLLMGLPAEELRAITLKFLKKYLVATNEVPADAPYSVNILDISMSLLGSADCRNIAD